MAELDRVRVADAILQEKARKAFISERVEWSDKIAFVVSRCTKGPQGWPGMFRVYRQDGPKSRQVLISGVGMDGVVSTIETAIRKRVFK
jgi:hypothetical protein